MNMTIVPRVNKTFCCRMACQSVVSIKCPMAQPVRKIMGQAMCTVSQGMRSPATESATIIVTDHHVSNPKNKPNMAVLIPLAL